MTQPYYVFSEEEESITAKLEAEGDALPYLSDEDFANLPELEQQRLIRMEQLKTLQVHYKNFNVFLTDVMVELGFTLTKVQADIGSFMANGPQYLMVQAQRSQAKTTIAAAFCVWTLIHDPKHRVLIISAGGSQATDISTLVIRIIMNMDILECMRPDKSKGDRVSVEKFDVHYSLRKLDKSASVSCCGITANLQGRRADLLLADDIESQKNSLTALMREQLLAKTLDFTSINQSGRILYLGTPQSSDSIYNTLPNRGYETRIWPGRFPNTDQLQYYGDMLAPMLRDVMLAHPQLMHGGGINADQGVPIEPSFLGEAILQKKERDQGPAWFQLQHMLNTRLMDAERYPLKTENVIVLPIRVGDDLPLEVKRGYDFYEYQVEGKSYRFARPHGIGDVLAPATGICFYIDPAGGGKGRGTHGGDETGWACTAFLNGNIYVLGYGGVRGGYDQGQMAELVKLVKLYKPTVLKIEQNFGYGAFRAVFMPLLREEWPDCAVEDDFVTGQKETRIIDTLEPIIARGSLIVAESALKGEPGTLMKHPDVNRITYCLMHQMNTITRDRDSLVHDDRLDALAGACAHWETMLMIDQNEAKKKLAQAAEDKFWKDPLGHNRYSNNQFRGRNMLANRRNKR
ncbi:phage DNA packaging [Yersinia phage phiR8-01]|uniref:Phage DNA packaging n=1 Tax=Yersinia phage phiR8-01 TaxID=1206556 RepID=I7J3S4_9CAUD|nr:terminase large subunit [Yersinia phage phiR8-01]CCI88428.2 phage DNA packaging [Yersinia phage phiR8-01]